MRTADLAAGDLVGVLAEVFAGTAVDDLAVEEVLAAAVPEDFVRVDALLALVVVATRRVAGFFAGDLGADLEAALSPVVDISPSAALSALFPPPRVVLGAPGIVPPMMSPIARCPRSLSKDIILSFDTILSTRLAASSAV